MIWHVFFIAVKIIEKCIVDTDFVDVDSVIADYKRSLDWIVFYKEKGNKYNTIYTVTL